MKLARMLCGALLFSIAVAGSSGAVAANALPSDAKPYIEAMLSNIHAHGFNPCAPGLYRNWDGNGANYDNAGNPGANACQPDRLADLMHLANLWRYKTLSGSKAYDKDIRIFTPIVQHELSHADPRGSVYHELKDLAALTGDAGYSALADGVLAAYAAAPVYPDRIDWTIEQGAALIASGNPEYAAIGKQKVDNALAMYFSGAYHLVFWGSTSGSTLEAKTSQQLDIAIALARAGYTGVAQKMATGLAPLWDRQYGGYYEGTAFIYRGILPNLMPETGKQGKSVAEAIELAKLLGDDDLLRDSLSVFYSKAYTPGLNGVVGEQQRNWALNLTNGKTEDWVSSEAMETALEALMK